MDLDRRHLLAAPAAALAAPVFVGGAHAAPAMTVSHGVDAMALGVIPGRAQEQTRALQRAIDQAAGARTPLLLPPGVYRTGPLRLPAEAQLIGVRGASRFVLTAGRSLLEAGRADGITLAGLILDGARLPLAAGRGLLHLESGNGVRITDCEVTGAGGQGIHLERVGGEVRGNTITGVDDVGLFSRDASGLLITGNAVGTCGNNGIQIWRSEAGHDGTLVTGNRIEAIAARSGGSGQNGNAVNVFRAHGVIVTQNQIRDCAFSAVRGNAASALQVTGNAISDCGEVAIYAEFGFEGAVIAHNTINGAAIGIAVTNFNEGGRMAVVQGNIVRRLHARRPAGTDPNDSAGIGIGVEADSAVTGNVVEDAPTAGIMLGWGVHLRDVAVSGNVIRRAGMGITVSVSPGAGSAVIADNLIAETPGGAIVGMDLRRKATGDLAREGAGRHAQLSLGNNRVR